eukprot:TRINITY_DN2959_c0_g1_i1.p1 TRINITY_DN2959_c0_g1~~TRINITY_DN2959_c0_g1_i1.p1  ORF type:complete len:772 (+),score=120.68 TRINITY_DN2959_c0_g1_i1:512-2827(+)
MEPCDSALHALIKDVGSKPKTRYYIVFLNDGSSSISPDDYNLSKLVLRSLLFKLPLLADHDTDALCQIAVVQFSNHVVMEQAMTSSRHALASALDRSVQLRSGTDTTQGLATAQTLLQVEPGAEKIVVLVTDGAPNDQASAISKATELKAKTNAHLYVVGIGSHVNQAHIRESASDGLWMLVPSYVVFDRIVTGFPSQPEVAPSLCAGRRSLDGVNLLLSANGAVHVRVEYTLSTGPDSKRPQFSDPLQMLDRDMIDFKIAASPSCNIEARMQATFKGGLTKSTEWIKTTTMTETKETKRVRDPAKLKKAIGQLMDRIKGFNPQEAALKTDPRVQYHPEFAGISRIRVAFLGPAGVGKSASACTINACTIGSYQPFRTTRQSAESVSNDVCIQPLFQLNPCIEVIDLWGYTPSRVYSEQFLRRLCKGNIVHGHHYDHSLRKSENSNLLKKPTLNDRVHAVVIYTSFHLLTNTEAIAELKKLYINLQNMGYQCVVVVTKADRVDPELEAPGHAQGAFTSEKIEELLQRLVVSCEIGREFIIPMINMLGQFKSEKDEPGIHYMVHRLLDQVLDQAVAFIVNQLNAMPFAQQPPQSPLPSMDTPSVSSEPKEDSDPSCPVTPPRSPSPQSAPATANLRTMSLSALSPLFYSPSNNNHYGHSPLLPGQYQQRQQQQSPSTPQVVVVTLRRNGEEKGGEVVMLPASMNELYELATEQLEIDTETEGPITAVRNAEGGRISHIMLIQNNQILHCLTASEEAHEKGAKRRPIKHDGQV